MNFTKALKHYLFAALVVGFIFGLQGPNSASAQAPDTFNEAPADLLTAIDSRLIFKGNLIDKESLSSVDGLMMTPDGRQVYALSPFSSAIYHFSRDMVTGTLTMQSRVDASQPELSGLRYPTEMTISADGAYLYVAAYDNFGPAMTVFQIDSTSGELSLLNEFALSGYHGAMTASGDSQYLIWAGWMSNGLEYDNVVEPYKHDDATGALNQVHALTALEAHSQPISSMLRSPDGQHIYTDQGLVFEVDLGLNSLRLLDGAGGYSGTLAIFSAEGDYLYVADRVKSQLTSFVRNSETGSLSILDTMIQGEDGIDNLDNVCGLGMTIAGSQIFATSCTDNSIAHFLRSKSTGLLLPHATAQNGANAVEGLTNPVSLIVSPDGAHVYVAGRGDDALVQFNIVTMTDQIYLPIITN